MAEEHLPLGVDTFIENSSRSRESVAILTECTTSTLEEYDGSVADVQALDPTTIESGIEIFVTCLIFQECTTSTLEQCDGLVADVQALDPTTIESRIENFVTCRICHEDDYMKNLESPCSCSGSIKYVHSKCVQRWCDQKGDTICEICQQPYQNGYQLSPRFDHISSPLYGAFDFFEVDDGQGEDDRQLQADIAEFFRQLDWFEV